jgi:hypothetical protein
LSALFFEEKKLEYQQDFIIFLCWFLDELLAEVTSPWNRRSQFAGVYGNSLHLRQRLKYRNPCGSLNQADSFSQVCFQQLAKLLQRAGASGESISVLDFALKVELPFFFSDEVEF